MTGMDRFSDKDKRKMRRQNKIARDLRSPKYQQRRIETNKPDKYKHTIYDDEE